MSTPAAASDEALAFRLSDIQLDEIMRLCQPLAPHCRDALLRILAYQLRGRRDVGDGGKFRPEHELLCGFDARQHAGDIASAAGRTVCYEFVAEHCGRWLSPVSALARSRSASTTKARS
jgi:hypothetical protein